MTGGLMFKLSSWCRFNTRCTLKNMQQFRFIETMSIESRKPGTLKRDEIKKNGFLSMDMKFNIDKYNQTPIANIPVDSPLTHSMLCFEAGARNEPLNFFGVSHILSHTILNSTNRNLVSDIVRSLQALGAYIKCINDRDSLIIYVVSHPDHTEYCLNTVYDGLSNGANKYHEFKYSFDSCLIDYDNFIENFPHECVFTLLNLLDQIHSFAFRNGLGNSLFLNPSVLIRHEEYFNMMSDYMKQVSSSPSCMVSIGNVETIPEFVFYMNTYEESYINKFNNPLFIEVTPPKFYHGELRLPYHHRRTYVSIAYAGSKKYGEKYPMYLILQKFLTNPAEYSHLPAPKTTLLDKILKEPKFVNKSQSLCGFNICYKDAGLFGITMAAYHDDIDKLVSTVTGAIKQFLSNPVVSDEAFLAAKLSAKFDFLSHTESTENFLRDLSFQIVATNQPYVSPIKRLKDFDSVSKHDFEQFAKEILSTKPIFAVLGNIHKVKAAEEYMNA